MSQGAAAKKQRRAVRWCVRVTYATGEDAYLRHGGDVGRGAIVAFPNRERALEEAEMVREGLDEECEVTVVRAPRI